MCGTLASKSGMAITVTDQPMACTCWRRGARPVSGATAGAHHDHDREARACSIRTRMCVRAICNPIDVSGANTDGRGSDPDNAEAMSEEYRSLRAESLQAKSSQQSILQWSIGAVGVVSAAVLAALAAFGDAKSASDARLRLAAIV